uniref:DUF1844 domain-containing protein n=1 Tax=mine drainage metagenome TaxID=410659 RepID=E6QKE5_9ZZZZ
MSETNDTPKFTVINRRKFNADEPGNEAETPQPATPVEPARLKLVESAAPATQAETPELEKPAPSETDLADEASLPKAPTGEESRFQKLQYEQSVERLDTLVRAQNPGATAPETIGFEHLVQQLYLSALMQMGAGTPEGQRPRVDILGARQTIDLVAVLEEKTRGNLSEIEDKTLQSVLFELRMNFLELTRMISMQPPAPPAPGGTKR